MPTSRALALCRGIVVVPPDMGAYARGVPGGDGDLRRRHPAGRAAVGRRGVPGRLRRRAAVRPARRASPRRLRDRIQRRTRADRDGRRGVHQVRRQAGLRPGQARRPADRAARRRPRAAASAAGPRAVGRRPATAERLESLGIGTVGEIAAHAARPADPRWSGSASGSKLHDLAWGRDARTVQTEVADSSIGAETTFAVDSGGSGLPRPATAGPDRDAPLGRARRAGVRGRTVSIKVRFEDFSTADPVGDPARRRRTCPRTVYATARDLLTKVAGVAAPAASGSGCSASGWRVWCRPARSWSSWNSAPPTRGRAGGRPRARSIGRWRGSDRPRSGPAALLDHPQTTLVSSITIEG